MMREPYLSVSSWPVHGFLHQISTEILLCYLRDNLDETHLTRIRPFRRFYLNDRAGVHDVYPNLRKLRHHRLAFFAYLRSVGFERPAVIPTWLVGPVLALERALDIMSRIPCLSHSRRAGKGIFVKRPVREG
jgi:hypothetical protein